MATVDLPLLNNAFICTNTYDNRHLQNWSTWHILTNSSYQWRGLIRPNLSLLPAGARIESVSFHIYFRDGTTNSGTDTLYRLRRDWVHNQVSGDFWKSGSMWTTRGAESTTGDRYSTAAGAYTTTSYGWYSTNINLSEFTALLTSNTGFLVKRTAGNGADKYFETIGTSRPAYFRVTYAVAGSHIRWFL